jgi:hypothetical protein
MVSKNVETLGTIVRQPVLSVVRDALKAGAVRLSPIADLKAPRECERSSRHFQPHQLRVAMDINFN